jgi:hypothetical protein
MSAVLAPQTRAQCFRNCKIEIAPTGEVLGATVCSLQRFRPSNIECINPVARGQRGYSAAPDTRAARLRARRRVNQLITCNSDLDVFFTLTLAPDWTAAGQTHSRTDYAAINRHLQQWLSNRVRRRGLKYVAVYEYHHKLETDGKPAIHVHGVANHGALVMQDAGRKYQDKLGHWHKIFNMPDWTCGITTAMYMYGDRKAATEYICKYIYKSESAVGGRWYMHSHNLQDVHYHLCNVDYRAAAELGRTVCCQPGHCSYIYISAANVDKLVLDDVSFRSPADAGAGGD